MPYDYDRSRVAARPIPIDKFDLMVLAEKVVRELPRQLRALSANEEDWNSPMVSLRGFNDWHYALGDFEVKDVRGHAVEVPVYVAASGDAPIRTRHWISGGSVNLWFDAKAGVTRKSYMMVKISGLATINGLITNLSAVEKEVYSVLIHEVTHLRDHFPGRKDTREAEPSERAYYNTPAEVRAFMQQTVDEVVDHAEAQAKSLGVGPRGIDLTSRFVEQALKSSATWQRVKGHLETGTERLIRRAVARALHEEWSRLEKAYPGVT